MTREDAQAAPYGREEQEAILLLRKAVTSLETAVSYATSIGFGSEVRGSLEDALRLAQYALAVAEDRT